MCIEFKCPSILYECKYLVDITHFSHNIKSVYTSDLNNDGYKEVIVGSHFDNTIIFYKNIMGDIQENQRVKLYDNSLANFDTDYQIISKDIDEDGLNDIIVMSKFENNIFWFKNLGNFNFSSAITILNNLNTPKIFALEDMDNDNDLDIVLGTGGFNSGNVYLFKNDATGIFSPQQLIYNSNLGVTSLISKDIDNNGYIDIAIGKENGTIYLSKNLNGTNFGSSTYISSSALPGKGFDFFDINNDTFLDIIISTNNSFNLNYYLSQNGNSFSPNAVTIASNLASPYNIRTIDYDYDGVLDIVVSSITNNMVGWYKNNNNSTFSNLLAITSNVTNASDFLLEDLNVNGSLEIIAYYSGNSLPMKKLAIFEKNVITNNFDEKVVNFYFGIANCVRIADLNNDGNNDIITGYSAIVWNENLANSNFSSQKLISDSLDTSSIWDIEIKDLNNDGFLDIIAITNLALEIYKNNGNETFDLVYSSPFSSSREI